MVKNNKCKEQEGQKRKREKKTEALALGLLEKRTSKQSAFPISPKHNLSNLNPSNNPLSFISHLNTTENHGHPFPT